MGSPSELKQLLSQARWSEDGSYLSDIVKNQSLPVIARVSHGTYASLGPSGPSTVSHVLLLSTAGKASSLVAQCVKVKMGRQKMSPFGPTLLIPNSYPGHFEILNEEGKAVPNVVPVDGLAKTLPHSCLVREPFKASVAESKEGSDEKVYRIGNKTRSLVPGELLTLVGQVSVPSGKGKVVRYVRVMDQDCRTLFLPCGNKGKFSPVAGEEGISGVHTTRGILRKRLPLMVRLVEGRPPTLGRNFKFFPELRLYSTLQEPLLFALPLSPQGWKDPSLLPLPSTAPLKFQVVSNMEDLEASKPFAPLLLKANSLLHQVKDAIQVCDINLQKELRFDGRQWKSYAPPLFLNQQEQDSHTNKNDPSGVGRGGGLPLDYELEGYEDIDELYDYVRGLRPTPPEEKGARRASTVVTITSSGPDVIAHVQNQGSNKVPQHHHNKPVPNLQKQRHSLPEVILKESLTRLTPSPTPPSPPPIETIPSRKFLSPSPPELSISVLNSRNMALSTSPGTQIQIQIRSGAGTPGKEENIVITTRNSNNKGLDSVGGSLSTTPTNTSGSAQSSSSSSSKGHKGRPGLYIKHQNQQGHFHIHHHNHNPYNLSGNPANRLLFRRSPLFDCRYKSLTDLSSPSLQQQQQQHGGSSGNLLWTALGRPKSLNSLVPVEEERGFPPALVPMPRVSGPTGVKKRLAEVVMPIHSHHHHLPKFISSSQRSTRGYRKNSLQHSALFL